MEIRLLIDLHSKHPFRRPEGAFRIYTLNRNSVTSPSFIT